MSRYQPPISHQPVDISRYDDDDARSHLVSLAQAILHKHLNLAALRVCVIVNTEAGYHG